MTKRVPRRVTREDEVSRTRVRQRVRTSEDGMGYGRRKDGSALQKSLWFSVKFMFNKGPLKNQWPPL